jgi:hypothetical protein
VKRYLSRWSARPHGRRPHPDHRQPRRQPGIRNFTKLTSLSVKVQRSDLANSPGLGSSVADGSAEDLGVAQSSTIVLGGGPLGSTGGNCTGSGLLSALALGGTIDTRFPLDEAPAWCG